MGQLHHMRGWIVLRLSKIVIDLSLIRSRVRCVGFLFALGYSVQSSRGVDTRDET